MNLQATDENFTVVSTSALDSLKRMVEELEKDAARYRWIRENGAWETENFLNGLNPEEYDSAVDAAMKQQ